MTKAFVLAGRELKSWKSEPWNPIIGWAFPVMIAGMFGLFFGGAMSVPDSGTYFGFIMPGIFALSMLFGLESTALAVATDSQKGIHDRLRSLPIGAATVVSGRFIADLINSAIGLVVLMLAGLALGWRTEAGFSALAYSFGLLMLLRVGFLWMGIFLGLLTRRPEALMPLQILIWPFGFLSSVFVDPATMPDWLGTIARWNPISATAQAIRKLLGNPGWSDAAWTSQNAEILALLWPLCLILVFMPLAAIRYRRLSM